MNHLPIRARLTAAFAIAMIVVLVATSLFVYLRLRADLNESINAGLRARAASGTVRAVGDPEESFVQTVDSNGKLIATAGAARGPVLRPDEAKRAIKRELVFERRISGFDSPARVLTRPVHGASGSRVIVAGQSLDDRDETLSNLVKSFAGGGALAVLIASILGYLLAASGLRPMEAMRRRAGDISLSGDGDLLPLPPARDEVRRLGETLNDMLFRLRRSFERERRFVADASHELRTPIAVVKTELEGLLRSHPTPDVRESLTAAIDECDHLAQLAEDLLLIARSREDQLPVQREPVNISGLFGDARDRFADRAELHGRKIRIDVNKDLIVNADPLHARRAVANLVDNALRHGDGEILLAARRMDGGAELIVSDHGPGFPGDFAPRAFERFSRADEARTRSGTGLGLAIVMAVATAHDGTATIVDGDGATVRIWFPDP